MAPFRRNRVVRRRRDGRFEIVLTGWMRDVLEHAADEVDAVLDQPDLPVLRRLQPNAYLDDPEQAEAWRLLAGDQLRSVQRDSFATLRRIQAQERATDEELWSWIQALNSIRLVFGTALGIEEDGTDLPEPDPEDPAHGIWLIYQVATIVQFEIVSALSGSDAGGAGA